MMPTKERTMDENTEQKAETVSPEGGTNAGTAVATRERASPVAQDGGVMPILPRNIPEATVYANGLIAANIVPEAFRYSAKEAQDMGQPELRDQPNKSLILMGVLQAMELGVAPQSGLKWLLPLRGRFTIWGDLAIGLAQQKGLVTKQTVAYIGGGFDENSPLGNWPDDFACEVRVWRRGQTEPYIGRFSVKDARRANLWMNSHKRPWIDYPKRMLFNRARAFALRDGFADALNGLEIAEEVRDMMPVEEDKPAAPSMAALEADTDDTEGGER
jgi:hypothetical protein